MPFANSRCKLEAMHTIHASSQTARIHVIANGFCATCKRSIYYVHLCLFPTGLRKCSHYCTVTWRTRHSSNSFRFHPSTGAVFGVFVVGLSVVFGSPRLIAKPFFGKVDGLDDLKDQATQNNTAPWRSVHRQLGMQLSKVGLRHKSNQRHV